MGEGEASGRGDAAKRLGVILLLLVAFGVRVGLIAATYRARAEAWYTPDSWGYIDLARHLVEDGEFTQYRSPEVFRTPGYPLLLAAFDGVPESFRTPVILLVQALLATATVYLTYRLGRELAGRRVGLLAGWFQAVTPAAIAACCRVLTETPYTLLFAASLWAIVRHLRGGSWRSLILSAVLLAAACYIRPSGIPMAGLYALALLFSHSPRGLPGRAPHAGVRRLLRTAAFAALIAAALAPWVVRNAVQADYAGFSSFATDSAYRYHGAWGIPRPAGADAEAGREWADELDRWAREEETTVGQGVRRRAWLALFATVVAPADVVGGHLRGTLGFWLPGATDVLELAGYSRGQRGTLDVMNRAGPVAAARHYFGGDRAAVLLAVPLAAVFLVKMAGVVICAVAKVRLRMSPELWLFLGIVLVSALAGGAGEHAAVPRAGGANSFHRGRRWVGVGRAPMGEDGRRGARDPGLR